MHDYVSRSTTVHQLVFYRLGQDGRPDTGWLWEKRWGLNTSSSMISEVELFDPTNGVSLKIVTTTQEPRREDWFPFPPFPSLHKPHLVAGLLNLSFRALRIPKVSPQVYYRTETHPAVQFSSSCVINSCASIYTARRNAKGWYEACNVPGSTTSPAFPKA